MRDLLTRVGLAPELANRAPRTLSGGQQQRVALARALAGDPQVLLADEPTSGLDIDAQDHLARLLAGLRDRDGLTLVLVTHDLRVAAEIADRLVVLEQGRVVEDLPTAALSEARHPATLGLLDAVDASTAPAAPIISARRERGGTPTTTRGAVWTP